MRKSEFVGHFWPGNKQIKVLACRNPMSLTHAFVVSKRRYRANVQVMRDRVLNSLTLIYGEHEFILPDCLVSTLDMQLKELFCTCKISPQRIKNKLSYHLGYRVSLINGNPPKLVILNRIQQALLAVESKSSFEIENILFF